MSTTTRTTEPTTITQGERAAWTRTFADYPADEYNLEYRFRNSEGNGFNVTATADGTAFDAVIAAAVSQPAKVAVHYWQAWLTEIATPTNTFPVDSGKTEVKRGFATDALAKVDLRTPAKISLDAITAAIGDKATADMLEYEISTPAGSRKVKRMSMKELIDAQKYFAAIVQQETARENAKKGKSLIQTAQVVMYDE